MDDEFLEGEVRELRLHRITCPECGEEGAQLIRFRQGQVVRCEACGLLELTRSEDERRPEHASVEA